MMIHQTQSPQNGKKSNNELTTLEFHLDKGKSTSVLYPNNVYNIIGKNYSHTVMHTSLKDVLKVIRQ